MAEKLHRYKRLVEALELKSIRQFELEIDIKESTIAQAIRRNSGVTRDIADKIVTRFPHVNRDWLLTGQGDMFTGKTIELHPGEPEEHYGAPKLGMGLKQYIKDWIARLKYPTAKDLEEAAEALRKIEEWEKQQKQ